MKSFRVNREQYVLQYVCKSKKVLHVGCSNSPNTIESWNRKALLHQHICDRAKPLGIQVIGIDIDRNAINFLKERMPEEKIYSVDAHKISEFFNKTIKFDLIIAGDVIEHLPNPGLFLDSCRTVLSTNGQILITTINSYGIVRFLKSLLNHEAVHPEHTAYYSHKTICRLLYICRLKKFNFGYYKCKSITTPSFNRIVGNFIENLVCIIWPQFSEGIVVNARLDIESTH